jgi:hypothetical protein
MGPETEKRVQQPRHDDPYDRYRFGVLPEPLTARPRQADKEEEDALADNLSAGRLLHDRTRQYLPSRSRDRIGHFKRNLIMPRIISPDQMRSFAERGYVVLPEIVPQPLIEAARERVDDLIRQNPPAPERRGFHFYWESGLPEADPLVATLQASDAVRLATSLVAPLELTKPDQLQVSLNIPIWKHRPGGPHIDGLTPPEPSGRPGTFTMLAGIFLTDQSSNDMGNLWVWPGSHHVAGAYLREHGPEAILGIAHPTYPMAPPVQITGRAGDLFLGHYLLGHNMGGNTSTQTRQVIYFRIHAEGHRERWRDYVQDPLLEFEPVRRAMQREG